MSKTQNAFLGIDISKATFDVCLLDEDKKSFHQFDNHSKGFGELKNWLAKKSSAAVHICMEATGSYGLALAKDLHTSGYQVSIVNPLQIKSFATMMLSRNKTDKLDAQLIAQYAQKMTPAPWKPLPDYFLTLQGMVRRREALKGMLQNERNRLSNSHWPQEVVSDLLLHQRFLEERLEALEKLIFQHISNYPELSSSLSLLCSIPGIGKITAAYLIAEIGPIEHFQDARQLAAYAGLTPRHKKSGTSVRGKTPISKRGNALLRKCLFMPALVAKRFNPVIQVFSSSLEENGKVPMEIVCAVMRKLLHICFGILKSQKPFDPAFHPVST